MGNCYQKLQSIKLGHSRSTNYRQIAILLVGLDNSGKTSVANGLSGSLTNSVLPTVGFSSVPVKFKGHSITLYDVGGGSQIRNIWSQYYGNVHGFIFIIDASNIDRLDECKEVFSNMIWNDKVFGKPILICLNKQDKEGTMHEFDITEQLDVEKLVNLRQCPTKVEICTALPLQQINGCRHFYYTDPSLISGFRWLVSYILLNYEPLNNRVLSDEKQQVEAAESRRKEWRLRKKGEAIDNDESPNNIDFKNPFKPISTFLKESDGQNAVINGSVGKTAVSSSSSHLKNVDVIIERNNILPPIEISNSRNSVSRLEPSFIKPDDKNSQQKSFTGQENDDDDDVNIFYSRALQSQNERTSSPDLSVFTISGKTVKSEKVVEINLDERIGTPIEDSDHRRKYSGKLFIPFRRFNKTAPAPANTLVSESDSQNEPVLDVDERSNGNSKSHIVENQSEPASSSNNFLVKKTTSANHHSNPGMMQDVRKSKGIFTRHKPVTSSTECILTDSDSADVVF